MISCYTPETKLAQPFIGTFMQLIAGEQNMEQVKVHLLQGNNSLFTPLHKFYSFSYFADVAC